MYIYVEILYVAKYTIVAAIIQIVDKWSSR